MMMIEDFKRGLNNSLKEIQDTGKQPESLKEETQKSLNFFQKNTTKMRKQLNNIIQGLKMDIDTIKKS